MSDKFKSQLEAEIIDMAYGQDVQPNLVKDEETRRIKARSIDARFGAVSACVSVVSLFIVILI